MKNKGGNTMKFEPASEGFLDFFKRKSKQPSKVEKK